MQEWLADDASGMRIGQKNWSGKTGCRTLRCIASLITFRYPNDIVCRIPSKILSSNRAEMLVVWIYRVRARNEGNEFPHAAGSNRMGLRSGPLSHRRLLGSYSCNSESNLASIRSLAGQSRSSKINPISGIYSRSSGTISMNYWLLIVEAIRTEIESRLRSIDPRSQMDDPFTISRNPRPEAATPILFDRFRSCSPA